MATDARKSDYITLARKHARDLWEAYQALLSMQAEWNAQDYGNTLGAGEGANEGIAAAAVGSVVFDTANAITGVMSAGHATNVTNLL